MNAVADAATPGNAPVVATVVCHGCGKTTHGEHAGDCGECLERREWCCDCWENGPAQGCRAEFEH